MSPKGRPEGESPRAQREGKFMTLNGYVTRQHGFTLVELLVTMTIGMVMSVAVMSALSTFEGRKRSAAAAVDVGAAGAAAIQQLDFTIRSAGSGFVQSAAQAYGCQLFAARGNIAVLPATSLPDPFTAVLGTVGGTLRVAPLVILKDNTPPGKLASLGNGHSDVLLVFAGAAATGSIATTFTAAATSSVLTLQNTAAFGRHDLVMVTDAATPTGRAKCMLQEVAGAGAYTPGSGVTALPLAGTFAAGSVSSGAGSLALTSFTIDATVTPMGNLLATDGAVAKTVDNLPTFQLLGVGNNASLYAYDLLSGAAAATPIADSVVELHALYGLDTDGDRIVDAWMDPGTSPYTAAELMAGTETAAANLARIKAVRIGVILRSPLLEKLDSKNAQVTGPTLALFSTLPCPPATPSCTGMGGFTYTRTLDAAERNFRYRTVELTIPLRNLMLD